MLIAETILAPLRAVPIFQSLTEAQIGAIAAVAERALYKPGDTLIEAETVADSAILIAWGEAIAFDGGDMDHPRPVPVGALLSEMAMFVDIEVGATIVARSAVRALRIPREEMLAVLAHDPDMADKLVQCVVGRLRGVVEVLGDIEGEFSHALDVAEIRHAVAATIGGPGSGLGQAPTH